MKPVAVVKVERTAAAITTVVVAHRRAPDIGEALVHGSLEVEVAEVDDAFLQASEFVGVAVEGIYGLLRPPLASLMAVDTRRMASVIA